MTLLAFNFDLCSVIPLAGPLDLDRREEAKQISKEAVELAGWMGGYPRVLRGRLLSERQRYRVVSDMSRQ